MEVEYTEHKLLEGDSPVKKRNISGSAPSLTEELRKQIARSLQPIRKDEIIIYRGTERQPIAAIRTPAQGDFRSHAAKLIRQSAKSRNLPGLPGALRFHNTAVADIVLAEPVLVYDKTITDLYELRWNQRNTQASCDFIYVLQPRNLEVEAGFIAEIPISLEDFGGQEFLVFHLGELTTRVEQEGKPRKQAGQTAPSADSTKAAAVAGQDPEDDEEDE